MQQGQSLDGFSQTHVIGKAGPKAPLLQKGEPGKAPRLIGPQGSAKLGRGRQLRAGRAALQLVEQLAEPARTLHTAKGKAVGGVLTAKGHAENIPGRGGIFAVFLPEIGSGQNFLCIDLHPLSPHLHQRNLEPGQSQKVFMRYGRSTKRSLPVEFHNGIKGKTA